MATHTGILAWRILWAQEPVGYSPWGHRVKHDWVTNTLVMGVKPLWMGWVQFSHSAVSNCDPMDCSMPGFHAHHQLLELTQTHVHQVGDAIQPSHPLSSPSPPSTENWIKDLLSMALSIRIRPSFLHSSLPYQEASISLLSLSLQERTGIWKPQSQKTNQTDYMDHSLV